MEQNRIREYREKLGISQVELARKARMAAPNLSNLERGRLAPWPRIMRTLARVLKATTEELFPRSNENGS
jgi:transcriptional regulator with XRE-family HTH domain